MTTEAGLKPSERHAIDKAATAHSEANQRLERARQKLNGLGHSDMRRMSILGEIQTREAQVAAARKRLDRLVFAVADSQG